MVFDVSERVSTLVREEVELAKTEVTEKVTKLLRGSAVGVAAGVFAFLGLILLMHSIAWLLDDLFFGDSIWIGFLVEAVLFFVDRGRRRLDRLQVGQGRLAADPGDRDRGGQADPPDARGEHHSGGEADPAATPAPTPVADRPEPRP